MTRAILDTSALTAPVQCGVRLFEELDRLVTEPEPIVPEPVVVELEGLSADNGEAGRAASVGRDLVDRCRVVPTEATYADDAVIELAAADTAAEPELRTDGDGSERVAVTNDGPLRDRLLSRDVRVIGIRGENRLRVTEP